MSFDVGDMLQPLSLFDDELDLSFAVAASDSLEKFSDAPANFFALFSIVWKLFAVVDELLQFRMLWGL